MSAKVFCCWRNFEKRTGQAVFSLFKLQKNQNTLADIWCFIFVFQSPADAMKETIYQTKCIIYVSILFIFQIKQSLYSNKQSTLMQHKHKKYNHFLNITRLTIYLSLSNQIKLITDFFMDFFIQRNPCTNIQFKIGHRIVLI